MIRPMVEEDAAAVAALIRLAFGGIRVPLEPPPTALRETEASVLAQLRLGGGAVWVATVPRAAVLWREEEGGLYIGRLSVHPEWQRRGIARALVDAARDEAVRRGLPRMHLGVRLAMEGNRRLFAAAGFRETELRTHEGQARPTWVVGECWL